MKSSPTAPRPRGRATLLGCGSRRHARVGTAAPRSRTRTRCAGAAEPRPRRRRTPPRRHSRRVHVRLPPRRLLLLLLLGRRPRALGEGDENPARRVEEPAVARPWRSPQRQRAASRSSSQDSMPGCHLRPPTSRSRRNGRGRRRPHALCADTERELLQRRPLGRSRSRIEAEHRAAQRAARRSKSRASVLTEVWELGGCAFDSWTFLLAFRIVSDVRVDEFAIFIEY